MTTDRDPQVAALLDVLEPEPPRAGFWVELEERLGSEPAPAVELHRAPGARSTGRELAARRRRVVIGVAAAVAVVAAVAGSLALRDDDRERGKTVPATTPDGPQPSTAQTTEVTYANAEGQALEAADLWIQRVADGDIDGGWDLLGRQSREQLGNADGFALVISEAATRYAPFADTPDRRELVVQLPTQPIFLVVLTVESEADAASPIALLVRIEAEGPTTVEPFVPGPALDLIGVPTLGGTPLLPGAAVPLDLDAEAGAVVVVVDGTPAPEAWLERDASGAVTGVRPQPGLEVGVHSIAVAEVLPGGTLATDARLFEVGSLEG